MGTVYKGFDTHTEQIVAIKKLHSNLADDQSIERFKREGQTLRDLDHPNIVKLFDTFEVDETHYLVMDYIAGGDLKHLLDERQLTLPETLRMMLDLADALTRAHKLGIIHRDLKPANVLLDGEGVLRLTDFGVAQKPVFLIELASISSADDVVLMIANELGLILMDSERQPLAQLVDYLRGREMLLVIDNFEHVLEAAPDLFAIVKDAPSIDLLVTSRKQLNQTNEILFALDFERDQPYHQTNT